MAVRFTPNTGEVQGYLKSIRKYGVLTPEREAELFKFYKESGDASARDLIIASNQRLVFGEAKRRARRESEIMDYVDEGNIGLSQAVEAYDPSRGFRFMTIAMWYVRRAMTGYALNSAEVKKSNAGRYDTAANRIKSRFLQDEMREPTADELLEMLQDAGYDVKDARDLTDLKMKSAQDEVSEDSDYDSSAEYAEATACRNGCEAVEKAEADSSMTSEALSALDPRSRMIIEMAFGIGYLREYADTEIAEKLGLTNMRISQLRREALKKMRTVLTAQKNR